MSFESQVSTQTVIVDGNNVLGPPSVTLTVNAQRVRIANVHYRSTDPLANIAAMGGFRDADSGSVLPLRAGAVLEYEHRLVERVELTAPANVAVVVDVEFGDGSGTAGPSAVLAMPYLPTIAAVAQQNTIASSFVMQFILQSQPGYVETWVAAHNTNAFGLYVGASPTIAGVWIAPGASVRFAHRPNLYLFGTALDRVTVTCLRPVEPVGSL